MRWIAIVVVVAATVSISLLLLDVKTYYGVLTLVLGYGLLREIIEGARK